jgi:hypothetical protein
VARKIVPGLSWDRRLSAFGDVLRGGFDTSNGGFILVWRSSELSRERLGYPETVRQLEARLQRCHPSNRSIFEGELAEARHGRGPTVFDWLVRIIRRNPEIELRLE